MIYLGIDPGSHRIGYGVIRAAGQRMIPLAYGVIENSGPDTASHFTAVENGLAEILTAHAPIASGVERLFFSVNRKTAMRVSEMRGVILATLARSQIPVREFTPLQVKHSICGYGKADKGQVQRMVRVLLGIRETIRPDDAADALAIALCCAAAGPPGRFPQGG